MRAARPPRMKSAPSPADDRGSSVQTHARTHARTHAHKHARTHARTRTSTHARTHAHKHTRTHARGRQAGRHTRTRTHTHTHTPPPLPPRCAPPASMQSVGHQRSDSPSRSSVEETLRQVTAQEGPTLSESTSCVHLAREGSFIGINECQRASIPFRDRMGRF